MIGWERARTVEQRETREREILEAARKLLGEKPYDSIKFSDLAPLVSFSRASIYKYFQSKGDVYLSLLSEDIVVFSEKVDKELRPNRKIKIPLPEQFCSLWSVLLLREKELLLLLSMAGNILEKNCSPEILLKSKKSMGYAMENFIIPAFSRFLPSLETPKVYEILNNFIILANGLYSLSGLSQEQKAILKEENLGYMISDFDTDYERICLQSLRSWILF